MKRAIFLLIFIPLALFSQMEHEKLIEEYLVAKKRMSKFSGVVAITQRGQIVFNKAYGFADKKYNVSNTLDSRFCLGSLTKQFTAAAILQLEDQKKLSLDDRLSKFFPYFPEGDKVTIQMLLYHTSGLPDYLDKYNWTPDSLIQSQSSILSIIKKLPYQFAPGTEFQYSNAGYYLLGCIIEKASNESYSDYMNNHIFQPASMKNSGILKSGHPVQKMAKDFLWNGKQFEFSTIDQYFDIIFSAGAMYSTTEDLSKWDKALKGTTLLSDVSKQKMFTRSKNNFGYGVIIDSVAKHLSFLFDGHYSWYTARLDRFVKDDISIIVLSNSNENVSIVSTALASIIFGQRVVPPYEHKEIRVKNGVLEKFIGTYVFKDNSDTIRIVRQNEKIFRVKRNRKNVELKAESATKLFYSDSDNQIEMLGSNNPKYEFIQNGLIRELEKIE